MSSTTRPVWSPVHPHVRGEHGSRRWQPTPQCGSPPRAWGTQGRRAEGPGKGRFTPTCVGNTAAAPPRRSTPPVHPHVRGEHFPSAVLFDASIGSPPRAWGTHAPLPDVAARRRFTPTCVGNTPQERRPYGRQPVHPHVRGEHARYTGGRRGPSGSPPRAWGTRATMAAKGLDQRFTPTCVGNTTCQEGRAALPSVHPHVRGEHTYICLLGRVWRIGAVSRF